MTFLRSVGEQTVSIREIEANELIITSGSFCFTFSRSNTSSSFLSSMLSVREVNVSNLRHLEFKTAKLCRHHDSQKYVHLFKQFGSSISKPMVQAF